jgi:hypothetical protein
MGVPGPVWVRKSFRSGVVMGDFKIILPVRGRKESIETRHDIALPLQ